MTGGGWRSRLPRWMGGRADAGPAVSDRIAGSLIGQCLADALGFVVEGQSRADCAGYVENVLRAGLAGSIGRGRYPFGQYTDDSQLARELAQSVAARGRFEPEDYARRIAAIFAEERIVGRGRATEAAAHRLARGVPWQQAGAPPPDAGNGGAMRAAPIGWLCRSDDPALVRLACDQARITHADPRSQAGAAAIAMAVAMAIEDAALDRPAIASVAKAVAPVSPVMAEALGVLESLVDAPPDEAHPAIAALGSTPETRAADPWAGTISPFVVPSVTWALYSAWQAQGDYWETVCIAISGGGDADTTAAMAGAISGAKRGIDGLPASLGRRVNDQGQWQYDALVALAGQIGALRGRG